MFGEYWGYVALIGALLAIMIWAAPKPRYRHVWEYRNPFTRTCKLCSRQEDWHCWAENAHKPKFGPGHYRDHGWWEEMRPGSGFCDHPEKPQ